MKDRGYTKKDASALEKLLDETLRDLDEIREALVEEADSEEALERTLAAIGMLGDGLNDLAGKRARRYLESLRAKRRRS